MNIVVEFYKVFFFDLIYKFIVEKYGYIVLIIINYLLVNIWDCDLLIGLC